MNQKKNVFWRTFSLFLLCCVLLCACRNGSADPQPTGEPTQTETDSGTPDPEPPADEIWLVKDEATDFCIVRTRSNNTNILNAPEKIQDRIKNVTGIEIPIVNSRDMDDSHRYLVIGQDRAVPETADVLESWAYGDYGYAYRNHKLMILGHTDILVEKALLDFLNIIYGGTVKVDSHVDLKISLSAQRAISSYGNWINDAPTPDVKPSGVYDCGNQTYMLVFQNFPEEKMNTYLENLNCSEFSKAQEHSIGENQFATYLKEKEQITYSYSKHSKLLRLTFQNNDSGMAFPNFVPEEGYEKLGETQLGVLSLNYRVAVTDQTDCGGISLVITLEDGRFIIIDGGYSQDATGLYHYLEDHNRRSDGIVIAAWIFTHGHGDHVGCFSQFLTQYASKVTCQYFVSNDLPESVVPTNESYNSVLQRLSNYCGSFQGSTKIIKPHTGQILNFCNLQIEMLLTHEDFYPRQVEFGNEVSLVFRITANGQTFLVTGDSELQPIPMLNSLYGSSLKSDLYQINHHGYYHAQAAADLVRFYQYVDADVAVWPTSQATVDLRKTPVWVSGIWAEFLTTVDECFVADDTVEILTFPYHCGDAYEKYIMRFTEQTES